MARIFDIYVKPPAGVKGELIAIFKPDNIRTKDGERISDGTVQEIRSEPVLIDTIENDERIELG